mmetsp:Transcript_25037/g.40210  ORF Transcript_25037/g.40210 Transcript_25037/m.40210 type:complete len:90 (-) Transcript_25037:87-356(-)
MLDLLRPFVKSIMIEGGASVIRSFIETAAQKEKCRCAVDQVIITIAPLFVGGLNPCTDQASSLKAEFPRFSKIRYTCVGSDIMLCGSFR